MKQITLTALTQNYAQESALFFTQEGKFITHHDALLLPVGETLERFQWNVQTSYGDDSVLMIQVEEKENFDAADGVIKKLAPRDYFFSLMDQPEVEKKVLRAAHWAASNQMLQFCSHCAAPLEKVIETTEKKCLECERSFFPKLSPAILVLIQHGKEILLARGPQHPPGMYSVLAGFIELGESAEETVHREVREEVGLEVTNLNYFGSQSWPFSDSFMIAFTADYLRGTIKIDPSELEEAHWFHREELLKPSFKLPPPSTLSRKLINNFLMRTKK